MESIDQLDRRRFAQQLLLGAGGLAAVGTITGSPAAKAEEDVPPAPKLPEDSAPPAPLVPLEALLLSYLVRTFPSDEFDEQAIQGIFRDIRGDVARGRVLAEFTLKNADEPAFVFAAYRGADGDR